MAGNEAGTAAKALEKGMGISDNGEIRLDTGRKQITVSTARTKAIAYAHLEAPVTLGPLSVLAAKGSALFALSSLDGKPIRESHRLLAIFATDADNSGMTFADDAARVIDNFGHLPVLIRKGEVTFHLPNSGRWTIAPVGLNGTIHPPILNGQGDIDAILSNDTPSGPTTYFLIATA